MADRHQHVPHTSLADMLRPINAALTPAIKLGFGNPLPFTVGLTVLEIPGRQSGRIYDVPLACYAFGAGLTVATVRESSQWFRNLEAAETINAWLWGRSWPATPEVRSAEGVLIATLTPA